jgi:tetratricopeptide (TPR) repeat protein
MLLWVLFAALQQPGMERALEDLKAGRFAEAAQAFERIATAQPASADAQFYLGIAQYQVGRPDRAIPPLTRATELNPKRAAAWKALGLAHAAAGNLPAAEEPFRKACDADPRNELACYYLGRNLQAQNRFAPAVRAFRRALEHERDTNKWLVHRGHALALEANGAAEEAEREFRKAVERLPGRVRAEEDPRIDYGVFLFRQGRAEAALQPLEAAAGAHPGSAQSRFQLARVLAQLSRLEPAAQHLEAAVAADPKHYAAHLLLGQVYVRLGRRQAAEPHLRIGSEGATAAELK